MEIYMSEIRRHSRHSFRFLQIIFGKHFHSIILSVFTYLEVYWHPFPFR